MLVESQTRYWRVLYEYINKMCLHDMSDMAPNTLCPCAYTLKIAGGGYAKNSAQSSKPVEAPKQSVSQTITLYAPERSSFVDNISDGIWGLF